MLNSIKKIFIFGLCFTSILSFASWIVSRHEIPSSESTKIWPMEVPSIAKAGFPFLVLELPQPPLGSDRIPPEMVRGVLMNELFWSLCGLLLAILFVRTQPKKAGSFAVAAFALGVIVVFFHFVLFALWFD